VVGRDRAKLEEAFRDKVEIAPGDISNPADVDRVLQGAETAIYAVGLPYPQHNLHPVLFRGVIEAAARQGVSRLVLISSVYAYGAPRADRVAETHPREPQTRKGRYRKEQEDIALAAHANGRIRTLILRLPDFYGPHAELGHADLIFRGAMKGTAAIWVGPADLPREFVFVPDVGPVLIDLVTRADGFGEAWNYGGPGTITGREFVAAVYNCFGRKPKFRRIGSSMLRVGGMFNSLLRELVEMYYLATTPVILDDSKVLRHLGNVRKTPYPEGMRRTAEWYRQRG
jgi:nucleoside-diphosphate-sugar epimerase